MTREQIELQKLQAEADAARVKAEKERWEFERLKSAVPDAASVRKAQADADKAVAEAAAATAKAQQEAAAARRAEALPPELDVLKGLSEVMPNVQPQVPDITTTMPEKSVYATIGVYRVLRSSVDDLAERLHRSLPGQPKDASKKLRFWWYDQRVEQRLNAYANLMFGLDLLENRLLAVAPSGIPKPEAVGPIGAMGAVATAGATAGLAIQGVMSIVGMAQSIVAAFKTRRAVQSAEVSLPSGVFEDLLITQLRTERNRHVNTLGVHETNPSMNFVDPLTLSNSLLLKKIEAVRLLLDKTASLASAKTVYDAAVADFNELMTAVSSAGVTPFLAVEALRTDMTKDEVVFVEATVLFSGASVATSEKAWSLGSNVIVDGRIVYKYRVFDANGTPIAADIMLRKYRFPLALDEARGVDGD